ncbi:MAG TPA: Holliday junction branch migration DNA helicase RuvB, partial [bacterium]|nr:Holliday junction branch migration DNA helicase RuvB [bacterium]
MDSTLSPKMKEEDAAEIGLRPRELTEYIGQDRVKENLLILIEAAKKRKEAIDHVLLYGAPGLGKTTLAHIIARELGANIRVTSGPALEKPGDLAAILTNLSPGDILFIDEIHRLPRIVEEVLYPAMEDYGLDIIIGKGPSAKILRLDLPRFSIIGATTRVSLLSSPLRDRFGMTYHLDFYHLEDLEKIIDRSARLLGISLDESSASAIAARARRTPRLANRLLRRVRDYCQVKAAGVIDAELSNQALELLEIDP